LAKKPIKITEVALRDAHQSLIATRMTMDEMRPILPAMDEVGYYSVECWGGATFDSCIRFLDEDPWDRLRILRKEMPNTKLQMLFRGQNMLGYRHYADDAVEYFVQKSVANGIDITHAKQISHMPTSTFLSVVSAQGRQIVGLDDMQISAEITPEFLAQREQTIVNAEMVAIDSSLPSDAIAWVCEKTSRPIFVRVVSVNKAARITPVLDRIDTMVLNSAEAKFVSGIEVHDEASARDCAEHLLRSGVRNVFLFVDDSDMLYCCEHESFFWSLPGRAEERRYTNGGASAALSALVWARREHKTQRECARYASAAAAMNMSQVQSICADFSEEAVRRKADLLQ